MGCTAAGPGNALNVCSIFGGADAFGGCSVIMTVQRINRCSAAGNGAKFCSAFGSNDDARCSVHGANRQAICTAFKQAPVDSCSVFPGMEGHCSVTDGAPGTGRCRR